MIRVTPSPAVHTAAPIRFSHDVENRAQARIFAGKATRVTGAEAQSMKRFIDRNPIPAGVIRTRVIAGELYVHRGQVYFHGITGSGQLPRLLKLGTVASLNSPAAS